MEAKAAMEVVRATLLLRKQSVRIAIQSLITLGKKHATKALEVPTENRDNLRIRVVVEVE